MLLLLLYTFNYMKNSEEIGDKNSDSNLNLIWIRECYSLHGAACNKLLLVKLRYLSWYRFLCDLSDE